MHPKTAIYCFLVVAALGLSAHGQVIRVAPSATYPGIQDAINASANDDIVEVPPGNWVLPFPLDFQFKNLTLRSQGGSNVTTLSGLTSKISLSGGQDSSTLIQGFTFTGSVGPAFGGAVLLIVASPTILECKFDNNIRLDIHDGHGAAVASYFSSPIFLNCEFNNNKAGQGRVENVGDFYTNYGGHGGAVFLANSSADFFDCRFFNNRAGRGGLGSPETSMDPAGPGGFGGDGGAIYAENTALNFLRCTFANNRAGDGGEGGLSLAGVSVGAGGPAGQGGAIRAFGGSVIMEQCIFSGNQTGHVPAPGGTTVVGARGGAISQGGAVLRVNRCTFVNNAAEEGGALNLDFIAGASQIGETIFAGNLARGLGGAIIQRNSNDLDATNCIFAANDAFSGSVVAIDSAVAPQVNIANSIIYFNFNSMFDVPIGFTESQIFTVEFCDVEGGYSGSGNFDADPLWAAPFSLDFHLIPTSPCIDAGNDNLTASAIDFESEPRVFGNAIDVGPDEYYGLFDYGEGTLVDGQGDLEPVLTINGTTGTPAHTIHLLPSSAFSIEMANPSLNSSPAQFILYGTLGIPTLQDAVPFMFTGSSFAFQPYDADPTNPNLFIVADSLTFNPVAYTGATVAPWVVNVPPMGMPITFTIQGFIQNDQGVLDITNAIVLEIK